MAKRLTWLMEMKLTELEDLAKSKPFLVRAIIDEIQLRAAKRQARYDVAALKAGSWSPKVHRRAA